MKVLLVQSYLGGGEPPVYPIGLACLKSALEGYDTRVFDTNMSDDPFGELKRIISEFAPDVIGISLRNIDSTNKRKVVYYYKFLSQTLDAIKEVSGAKIVVGGSGFSMFAEEIMKEEPRIDLGVLIEGEKTFPALLENLEEPAKVKSVFYRKDGRVVFSGPGDQVDLDLADLPDRKAVPTEDYMDVPEAIGVETKRGCMLDCIYCIYGFLNGKRLRPRRPAKVVDEISMLVENHGVSRFTFLDSVFNIPLKQATDICREIIDRGLKVRWSAWFNEKYLPDDFVALAVEAGCDNFILSPDGFSDKVLRLLGKNIGRADILRAHETLRRSGASNVSYNFFKNPPGQSLAGFLSLALFCVRAKAQMGRRVHFEFNSMRVEPHTRLHVVAMDEGLVGRGDSLLYPVYYTNRQTRYIEALFNAALRLKGK